MSQIVRSLSEIARCGLQYRSDCLSSMGMKACHISYLVQICENPGISQDKLSRLICINKSNVARQAAILEEEGFVTRTPSPTDKRIMELHPTQKTLDLLPQVSCVLKEWETCITGDLTSEELDQLAAIVAKMKTRATDYMDGR